MVLSGLGLHLYAQTSPVTYSFVNYNVNQGLPSSEVYDLYQSPENGLMWIATDRGLVKYDGYDFITYTVEDGLTDNVVLSLTPDRLGNIWCNTLNDQPFYLDRNNHVHPFKYNNELRIAKEQKSVGSLVITGLYLDKNKSLHLAPKHYLGEIIMDSSGKVSWELKLSLTEVKKTINFLPDQEYYYYSTNPTTTYSYPIDPAEYISPGMIHKINDTIFLLTIGHKIELYKGLALKRQLLTSHPILHSGKLNDSLFWVSYRSGGVDFFDLSGELKTHLLEHDIISDVIEDHEKGIWLSSVSNGIFYLKNTRIKTCSINPNVRLISISSMREKLFLGYYSGDVFTLDVNNFRCDQYNEFKCQAPVTVQGDTINNRIYLATRDLTGWSGAKLKGITCLNLRSTKVSEVNGGTPLFFSSYNGFFVKKDEKLVSLYTPMRINDVTTLGADTILATHQGLFKYSHGNSIKIEKQELDFRIEDVDKFKNGILCATLGNGLAFYSVDTLFFIKKTDGLLSNLTTEVFVQNDSTIWLATIAGANKIIFNSKFRYTVYSYTTSDGLISNEVVDFDETNKHIWIATKRGLNFIDKNDQPVTASPDLFLSIQKVIVNGREITISDNRIALDYNNNVEVFFSAISFSQNQSLIYSYQLLPKNKEWYVTSNRSIVFPALSPGKYQLKIRASVDHVHWSREVILEMTITPPYWKTKWFIFLVVVGIASILVVIFLYRLKQQKLKTNALEMEMKALRAQMNPHFIFNSMASIQSFILKGNVDDSNNYLTKFSRLIRGVLENSKTELITLKKELEILNLYIELESLRVKPFEYKCTIDPAINIENLQIPPMLLQPFIENAIWHGLEPIEKKVRLQLELKILENKLMITIDDNGVGRNYFQTNPGSAIHKMKEKSFGVEITRERIHVLNKIYHINIQLNIIDKLDENDSPDGTRIEILLPIIKSK